MRKTDTLAIDDFHVNCAGAVINHLRTVEFEERQKDSLQTIMLID